MNRWPLLWIILLGACKTTSSDPSAVDPNAIANMNEEEFVTACQERLQNAEDGEATKLLLMQYAQTSDCRAAFPTIKKLVSKKAGASD